ncbi:MAG: DUF2268 domain-containing putative Zn-dependent protease [Prevotella sp.]|jgi:hypothetical protein|nr:DUF2268 domain-containing putative Zn-dependent protease [Prevotella sp.]
MKNISYLLVITIISFIACSSTTKKGNDNEAQAEIKILRFDKDIYNYLQNPNVETESQLKDRYPLLLPAFGRVTMNNSDPETFFLSLREYFSHPALMGIYKDALSTFDNLSPYEQELTLVNQRVSEHLTGKQLPQFAMHVSGFRENVIILNNLISISADKYLGSNYAAYKEFFQPYERQQMQPQFIVKDYTKAWLMSDIIKTETENQTLLSAMIDEGKILYALSILLPETTKDDLMGYTSAQSAWCKENEKETWKQIVKQNYLFSTDYMLINRIIDEAQATIDISEKSPGRLGCWIGWQIIEKYAKRKDISLQEIINTDAQTILKDSKYNP